jgi:hypothetical protein
MSTEMTGFVPVTMERVAAILHRTFWSDVHWLEGMSWRRIGWFFIVAAALTAYSLPSAIFDGDGLGLAATLGDYMEESAQIYMQYLWALFPVLLALTFADNLPLTGRRRQLALLAALLLGVLANWPLACVLLGDYYGACRTFPSWKSWLRFFTPNTATTFFLSGAIALAFFAHRHDRRVEQALHAAELAHVDTQRRTLEADLWAMQAQVEPAFLLGTLEDVGRLNETDPDTGDRVLDALIVFLRTALPQLREATSTVAKELDLARAYLSIAKVRLNDRLSFYIDAPENARGARMPPMLLLPLLESAVNHGPEPAVASRTIKIGAVIDSFRATLTVTDTGVGFVAERPGEDGCEDIRARLNGLYGQNARLDVRRNRQHGTRAVLEIPYERIEGSNC